MIGLYGTYTVLRQGLDLRRDCELVATDLSASLVRFVGEPEPLDLTDIGDALSAQIDLIREHIAEPVTLSANAALRSLIGAE